MEETKIEYVPLTFSIGGGGSKSVMIPKDRFLDVPDIINEFLLSKGIKCHIGEIISETPTSDIPLSPTEDGE